jgi:hypothetical protein
VNDRFFPRGAIAAFVALMVLYGAIWYALYFLAVARG